MKKLFSILILFTVFSANSQIVSTMPLSAVTLTNASTVTATLQTQSVCENITIQAIETKSTGTVAGSVTVSASIDGINYVVLPDTFAPANVATNTHLWEFTNNNYMYWKVTFLGAGTMVSTPAAYLFTSGATNKHATQNLLSAYSATSDTTDNTGTSYITLPVTNWYNTVSVQSVVTKISGTVAGTVTLLGSLDGTNYNTVDANYLNVTNYSPTNVATSTKIFVVTGSPYRYYRLSYTGAGTMSASHRGYLLPNKK